MFPAVLLVCIVNGMTSPFVDLLFFRAADWLPIAALGNLAIVFYLCSLATATLTLLAAGVPAALFERVTGRTESDAASFTIWAIGALVLTLPGILNWLGNGWSLT
ncbi:MAG: hypothetical protein AB7G39_17080 [Alphaproteobacteria bacterium]